MELAVILGIVNTILSTIQFLDKYKALISFPDCKRQLADLETTVNFVKSVLDDADAKQDALNCQHRVYIEQLKDAVYDADDVLDEFVTLVKRKKITADNHKLSDKVPSFISRFSSTTRNLSSKVKEVNKKLDAIASNTSKFLFKIDNKKLDAITKFNKEETCSFVSENDEIIGRENDVEKIVEMLLHPNDDQPNVLSLSIVGMGGLGKTALAQLVYNDPRVASAFQLKCWTCIADQDQEQWSLPALLGKVLKELPGHNAHQLTSLEKMQCEVKKLLGGTRYLLVLDDVWTESYERWLGFEKFLKVGQRGSRIVVTTRSKTTSQMIGGRVHELQGLSKGESWRLFERMAFLPEQRETPDDQLVKLGEEIVKKCINVPLALRVVGSLLRDQPKTKWELFQENGLANVSENDRMNHILKLSYHQLDSSLKSCFAYCAIFPKDFEIHKQMLISLWMAQGYINVECKGEEYFRILWQRCFFQDLRDIDMSEDISFKIHDLLHDIAEQVAGMEICKLNSGAINLDKRVRHLSLLNDFCPQGTFRKAHIRTFLQVACNFDLGISNRLLKANLIENLTCLRSLDLRDLEGDSLPESIGKMFHLRYLDLTRSGNLEVLPKSITKLVNLQTLMLPGCERLKELPNDIYRLVNLTTLDLTCCFDLSHMHSNLGMLTNLHTLREFNVGGSSSYEKRCFDGLEVLRSLNNLKGFLQINIEVHKNARYNKENYGGGAYLLSKEHLNTIYINLYPGGEKSREWEQSLLEDMQPHVNIKHLYLSNYNGETMPRWPRREDDSTLFYLPNLIKLNISYCRQLRLLPSLEELPHLKTLKLDELWNVEYMVNINLDALSLSEGSSFFPCLEQLCIRGLRKLTGWWAGCGEQNEPSPCFGKLKKLKIDGCPMLKSIPICSSLESVKVYDSLRNVETNNMALLPQSYKSWLPSHSKSKFVTITDFERRTSDGTDPNPTE